MRFLRLIALLLVVALAYSAQFILHSPSVRASTAVLPSPINGLLPDVGRLRALFVGDLRDMAFFMMAMAAVTFGLLAAPWSLTEAPLAPVPATFVVPKTRRRHRLSWLLVIGAVLLALGASWLFWIQFFNVARRTSDAFLDSLDPLTIAPPAVVALVAGTPWLTTAVWTGSLLFFLGGCALFPWRFQQDIPEHSASSANAGKGAMASWPLLVLLLLVAALFYSWRLATVPLLVEEGVARVGLWAKEWLYKGDPFFYFGGPIEFEPGLYGSGLATAVPALFFWLTHDLLLSIRLSGVWGALLTINATWLLGTELFQRMPTHLAGEAGEDQGQGPALLAAFLVMATMATMLFSRIPVLLETVGWGTLGCWALVRGLRTGDRLAVGLSALLISLSAILYTPGVAFVLTALFWWAGYRFVQSGWLPHRLPVSLPAARFRGYFLLWVGGLWVMAAPMVGVRWFAQQLWLLWQPGNLATAWQPTLLALIQQGDQSQLGGLAMPLVHNLLAPLLFLALGALCFNFDRRLSWLLLTWLGSGLLCAMLLPPTAANWPALLPIVPALGLLLAFGLDRLRMTVLQSAGMWSNNLLNYLFMGLLLWVGLSNGVEHYHLAQQQVDALSALGQELRTLPPNRPIFVVGSPVMHSDAPQLRFFTNDWQRPARANVTFQATLPAELPAGAVVLLVPADAPLLAQLQIRYPTGTLVVRRDHLVNLLLYRYTLPEL